VVCPRYFSFTIALGAYPNSSIVKVMGLIEGWLSGIKLANHCLQVNRKKAFPLAFNQ
jgi:hypothetical protein